VGRENHWPAPTPQHTSLPQVLVTGAGPNFCAGIDLAYIKDMFQALNQVRTLHTLHSVHTHTHTLCLCHTLSHRPPNSSASRRPARRKRRSGAPAACVSSSGATSWVCR
jgi:hypothetical protein